MGTLTVYFVGICTHFLPQEETGGAHRVVLVNAEHGDPSGIKPHYAELHVCRGATGKDTLFPLKGVTITVPNVLPEEELVYHRSYMSCIPRMMRHTRERIDPNPYVVRGEEPAAAAAYFDLTGGELRAGLVSDGAAAAVATIRTFGHPAIMLSRFGTGERQILAFDEDAAIEVRNVATPADDSPLDFLLHFRTVISLTRDAWPAMKHELCDREQIDLPCLPNTIGPGCSNSNYP